MTINLYDKLEGTSDHSTLAYINNASVSSLVSPLIDQYVWAYHYSSNSIVWTYSGATFNGDISGNSTTQTVKGLQNIPVLSNTPTDGQILYFNGSDWLPASLVPTSQTFSGDMVGTTTSTQVVAVNGTAIPANPSTVGNSISFDGVSSLQYATLDLANYTTGILGTSNVPGATTGTPGALEINNCLQGSATTYLSPRVAAMGGTNPYVQLGAPIATGYNSLPGFGLNLNQSTFVVGPGENFTYSILREKSFFSFVNEPYPGTDFTITLNPTFTNVIFLCSFSTLYDQIGWDGGTVTLTDGTFTTSFTPVSAQNNNSLYIIWYTTNGIFVK
jgi:hypothetical protein